MKPVKNSALKFLIRAFAILSIIFIVLGLLAAYNVFQPQKPVDNLSIVIIFAMGLFFGIVSLIILVNAPRK
jgi:uncharacterized membrane protein